MRQAGRFAALLRHSSSLQPLRLIVRRTFALSALSIAAAVLGAPRVHAQNGGPNETPSRQPKLTKVPKLVQFVEAVYPESEKAAGTTASVILQIAITDKGTVEDAAVLQSAGPAFDAAALEAVKKFIFEPAEVDDKPAPVKITYKYDFVINEEPAGPAVNYEGVIRDHDTKKPIANLKVTIEGVGETTTDEEGHFEFDEVPLGKHPITISGEGFATINTEENIEEGKHLEVKYTVTPKAEGASGDESDLEILVVAPRIKKEILTTEIKVEEGRRVPGTQGDTLKVVQNLPGVARAAFGSGQLVVWGAAPQDTRVYVDGVRVPLLYHGGGLRSTINSDIVRAINLSPGGYGAEFGHGLGGLVTVDTRAPRADGYHGYAAADVIDASAMVEGPIGGKTRFSATFRQSYLDRTLKLATSRDVGEFIPIPTYYDAQVKLVQDLGDNESIELFVLASRDNLVRTVTNPDPAQTKREEDTTRFTRIIVEYKKQSPDGSSVFLVPSVGTDFHDNVEIFGGSPTEIHSDGVAFGFRAGYRGKAASFLTLAAGLDAEGEGTSLQRLGAVSLPPREGDVHVFGQLPPDQVNFDRWKTVIFSFAPYGQADFSLLDGKLHVVPGLRLEPYVIGGNRITPAQGDQPQVGFAHETTAVEPRLSAHYQVSPAILFKAAFGIYHQAPLADDLSSLFGNPNLDISRATHWLAGYNCRISDAISLEMVGFYSATSNLVSRSTSPAPVLAQALVQEGEGRAFGGQLLLRHELTAGFFGWASYSVIRSERRDHPNSSFRLFDFDQTHVATVVASYELGAGFEVGARFRYSSGFPRTPVSGSFYLARRDVYEPIFGRQNSIRIPAFMQLDARVSKRFTFENVKAEVYLDVQNVTNRDNAEDIVYNFDYTKRDYITGLPLLPVAGARIEW
jgi:TonB family protein